ncbi:MAG: hypothetical protein KDD99_21145 [Bacteroidetes bacterium]|nr:hypothetical protein [Bacteroidota bacterium]
MKNILSVIIICLLGSLLSCGNPRKGALDPEVRTELDLLAEKDMYVGNKYMRMAEKYALLLEEASAMPIDEEAMAHLRDFFADNQLALTLLSTEFDRWQKYIDNEELTAFALKLRNQPFSQKLKRLIPAFRKRISYNQEFVREYDHIMSYIEIRN